MVRQKSLLASQGLEDLHAPLSIPLTLPRIPSSVEQLEEGSNTSIPSLTRRIRPSLVNYPCRLRSDQLEALNHLKATLGVLPADLIRDAVDLLLRHIKENGVPSIRPGTLADVLR